MPAAVNSIITKLRQLGASPAHVLGGRALEAGVIVMFLAVWFMLARHIPLSGDEYYYYEKSAGFAAIDQGWFMPGMSMLLSPITAITDSIEIVRLYIGLINASLICFILKLMRERFGDRFAAPVAFVVVAISIPYYALYCFSLWGDLLAAHAVISLCLLAERVRVADGHAPVRLRIAALFGLALGVLTYLRGQYYLFLPLLVFILSARAADRETLFGWVKSASVLAAAATVTYVLVLAPWTYAVSVRHGFHLTTTSANMSQTIWLADQDFLKRTGNHKNVFFRVNGYMREYAKAENLSYRDATKAVRGTALADLTLFGYATGVEQNLTRFLLTSESFLQRFKLISANVNETLGADLSNRVYSALMAFNHFAWRVLLGIGLVLFVVPMSFRSEAFFSAVIFKYVFFIFTLHPFIVWAHGRYYVQYVPLIACAIAICIALRRIPLIEGVPKTVVEAVVGMGQGVAILAAFGATVLLAL